MDIDEVMKLVLISKPLIGKKGVEKLKLENEVLIFDFKDRLIVICSDERSAQMIKTIKEGKEVNKNTFRFGRKFQELITDIRKRVPGGTEINVTEYR